MANNLENVQKNLNIANDAIKYLDKQIKELDNNFSKLIEGLSGEESQTVTELQAMTKRVINKAKKGGDYQKELESIKNKFKNL